MNLLIIESPGKAKKLASILGSGWRVMASVGHIRDLPEHEIGVEPPTFVPTYVLSERGREVAQRLRAACQQASSIYLGTDPDREGEAIAWHIAQELGLRQARRITFNEITDQAVRGALAKPRGIDNKLVAAQEARRVLDRLVGYLVSPVLSELLGEKLSAGRVQTPAVRLVVEREREIAAFKPTDHFGVRLRFADAKREAAEWFADWLTGPFTSEDQPYVLDEGLAQRVAAVSAVEVSSYKDSERRRAPPPPFITASLQQAASVRLGLDPEHTMRTAQALYEAGHITYHRTDNPNISPEHWPVVVELAERRGLAAAPNLRTFPAPDGAQAGHHAITPTQWDVSDLPASSASEDERALYALIHARALASQLADARYAVRKATLSADLDGQAVAFVAKSESLVFAGWTQLQASDDTQEADEEAGQEQAWRVPELVEGERLAPVAGEIVRLRTRAPKRYTKASLIGKLESEGVGRPSTYAAIMANIEARGYIEETKRFLRPTAVAERVIDALATRCAFAQLQFTSALECDLDRIAAGTVSYTALVESVHDRLQAELGELRATTAPRHPCPECGSPLRRIRGEHSIFWGCIAYPSCDVKLADKQGQPVERQDSEPSKYLCRACGKPLVRRKKTGKNGYDFWGCSGFRDGCRASYENKRGKPVFKGGTEVAT